MTFVLINGAPLEWRALLECSWGGMESGGIGSIEWPVNARFLSQTWPVLARCCNLIFTLSIRRWEYEVLVVCCQ